MTHKEVYDVVQAAVAANGVVLSEENHKWLALIREPLGFYHSEPDQFCNDPSLCKGEQRWQRELYNAEERWYDLELPVGQSVSEKGKHTNSNLIDLLGYENGAYLLCELKYADNLSGYKPEDCDAPFDALLQLLAYYAMLVQNSAALDASRVHHTTARNTFRWQDVCKNVKLLLKATPDYWNYWQSDVNAKASAIAKHSAYRTIIEQCGKAGLVIVSE